MKNKPLLVLTSKGTLRLYTIHAQMQPGIAIISEEDELFAVRTNGFIATSANDAQIRAIGVTLQPFLATTA